MDDLKILQVLINDKAFSRKGTKRLNRILKKAMRRGYLYDDEKIAMQFIMDYEKKELALRKNYTIDMFNLLEEFYTNFTQKIASVFKGY